MMNSTQDYQKPELIGLETWKASKILIGQSEPCGVPDQGGCGPGDDEF